jgi:hypothetical protein
MQVIALLYCGVMINDFHLRPLARWDGLHLVLDLKLVEGHLNRLLANADRIGDLRLRGEGDAIAVQAVVEWKGVRSRVGLDLAEIRLRHRHIGFRMRRLRALGGVPVPRTAVEIALSAMDSPLVTVFRGEGIVVIDLRQWLPEELDLEVLTVQAPTRSLHLWFGPGSLKELPDTGRGRLPAKTTPG